MMNKILSVSIAAYNIEKYIDTTVCSLLNEKIIDEIEILIISDGSTDSTVSKAREYEKKYPNSIKIIEKDNGGWGSTVNTAIKNAKGKYLKLLDGDDQFITKNLSVFLEYLMKQESDLILTPYIEFLDETNEDKEHIAHGCFAKNGISVEALPSDVSLNMHECCFRTSLLKENKICITENCYYTDIEFVIKGLAVTQTISFLDKTIYRYRIASEEQSMSINGFRKHYKEHLKMLYNMLEFEKKYLGNLNVKNAIKNRLINVVKMQYNIFCLLEGTSEQKNELIKFDKTLKEKYPDYYKSISMKKVNALRKSKYILYGYICRKYYKKQKI